MKLLSKTVLAVALLAGSAQADVVYDGTSVGAQAGIFGLGLNLKGKFSDTIGVKVGFDQFTYNDITIEDDEVKYNFDVDTKDMLATLEYHPWMSSFKVSGGVLINNSVLDGDITPNTKGVDRLVFDFNGNHYDYALSELGSIHTKVDFDPVAPYAGFGWDTSFNKKEGFGFTFDVGIAYQGSAKSSYSLKYGEALDIDKQTANIPDSPAKDAQIALIKQRQKEIETALKKDLDAEMLSLQQELDKYEWMPYISIGVNYKF